LVFTPPGVGKRQPIEVVPEWAETGSSFARDAAPPIDQCTEHVEQKGAHVVHGELG
jgi:hypothetical protein